MVLDTRTTTSKCEIIRSIIVSRKKIRSHGYISQWYIYSRRSPLSDLCNSPRLLYSDLDLLSGRARRPRLVEDFVKFFQCATNLWTGEVSNVFVGGNKSQTVSTQNRYHRSEAHRFHATNLLEVSPRKDKAGCGDVEERTQSNTSIPAFLGQHYSQKY